MNSELLILETLHFKLHLKSMQLQHTNWKHANNKILLTFTIHIR